MAHGELVALWQPMGFKPFHVSGIGFQLTHDGAYSLTTFNESEHKFREVLVH